MKRLSLLFTVLSFVLSGFCEDFRIDYRNDSNQQYSLAFRELESEDEVALIEITIHENIDTISLPSSVCYNEVEYAVVILDYSISYNDFSITKIIIPSSVKFIYNK